MADETFENADAGASLTIPVQAGQLRKGDFVCINGFPCKVADVSTSKTGKHGHAKANITAIDIFTAKKYEEVAPTSHNLPQPVVTRTEYLLTDVKGDGFLALMNNDTSDIREDLALPADADMSEKIKAAFDNGDEVTIVVVGAMGKECVMDFKVPTN